MTSKPKVRGGIVGSGFAANLHYEGIRRVYGTDIDLAGVFSPTADNAQRFAGRHGLRTFSSLEALLDEVQVVHVCASPAAHEAITVAALAARRACHCREAADGMVRRWHCRFPCRPASSMQRALDGALASIDRMLAAEAKSKAMILYAENWVYAPAIQKEREIIEKTSAQVLWMHGEEAHSGSHSKAYGFWRLNGGGALIGKGVHPLTAALYLKRVEGRARNGRPIRPAAVSARMHSLTRLDGFADRGFLRTDYHDVEDFSSTHVVFEDGTVADIFASEIVMGGIHNWLEVMANNHRAVCNINPNTAMQTYNPSEDQFRDIYVVEKIGTKQGWAPTAPDEDFITGFPQEIEAFYRSAADRRTARERWPPGCRLHLHGLQRLPVGRAQRRRGGGARVLRPAALSADGLEQAEDAARHEDDEENEQDAVDGIGGTDEVGAEPHAQTFRQRQREQRSDRRAEQGIHAAGNGGEYDLQRHGDARHRLRIEIQEILGEQGAAERGQRGADDGDAHLFPQHVDPHRGRGFLVLRDRLQRFAPDAAVDAAPDGKPRQPNDEGNEIEVRVVRELERVPGMARRLLRHAERPAVMSRSATMNRSPTSPSASVTRAK